MQLDTSVIGFETAPHTFTYDWKSTVLYALGIGAGRDELAYLYEGYGPKVFPTFAVIAAYPAVAALFAKVRCDMTRLVHGSQGLRFHREIPPQGSLQTVGKVSGIYDMKRFGQVVLTTSTSVNGEPCFDTEWSLIIRDAGGFGGARPPKHEIPKIPDNTEPSFRTSAATRPDQALLYRLSGDLNPLHADPEFARQAGFVEGPILHGLCTFGYVARAVIQQACNGDARQLKSLSAQFRRPVWPGEVIVTEGYLLPNKTLALEAFAEGRKEPVITNAWAEIA